MGTTTATLARLGFTDTSRAERLLDAAGLVGEAEVVQALGEAANPDLAVLSLTRVLESDGADPERLRAALRGDPALRRRLAGVLGASAALGDHLARHPGDWRELAGTDADRSPTPEELRAGFLRVVGADPGAETPAADLAGTTAEECSRALRVAYRRRVLRLAARDLTGVSDLAATAAELADLASAFLDAALALARGRFPEEAAACRLAVIGMGKCGARELNYVSDVDVIFVAEPATGVDGDDGVVDDAAALRAANRLATALMGVSAETDGEGTLWQVDPNLRPEGKNGPLVRTLASHRAYYERWAKTWEFQALLKARPLAGDRELGAAYVESIFPLVWQVADRPDFVDDVQAMRRRVEAHIPPREAERQLKLGEGGLRDIEFAVQLLQLVHGRSDPSLRAAGTLESLAVLSAGGYVGRADATELGDAYQFLRRVEHLLQLSRLRRTHLLPDPGAPEGAAELRRLGRALGYLTEPAAEFTARWRRCRTDVRRLHEKLFYRPLLKAVARLPGDEARLSLGQARDRLEALGFVDPAGALRHLEALTTGVSRRAAIQRTLLPVMLGWFADSPDPDAGLLGFRQVSDALGSTPWYLRLLRDDVRVAERFARLLGSSRYITDLLLRAPEGVALLASDDDLRPRDTADLAAEAHAALRRHDTAEKAVAAVRALRRRELLRTGAAELLDVTGIDAVGPALTAITTVTVDTALRAALATVAAAKDGTGAGAGAGDDGDGAGRGGDAGAGAGGASGGAALGIRFCVIGMGRFGGGELGYASDADVMFVHEPLPGTSVAEATAAADAVVRELRRLLEMPAANPPLHLDADLRPEGRNGPMVRTFDSYATYYARWASTWESQALLRAVPVAGDAELGARFRALVDPLRYPAGGVDAAAVREIRRLKARMESERLPRGADPATHTKLGRGGLSDVEWVVQLLQLRHAHECPELRTTGTLAALAAATEAGLVEADDAATLETAWRMAVRVRGAIMLVRGRGGDSIPTDHRTRAAVATTLGYRTTSGAGAGERMVDDYLRVTRRARTVMERLFYD